MHRNLQSERDKALLSLQRERNQLRRQRDQMVRIDPPIQRGWVRRWRLTQKAKKRPDAAVLMTILTAINTEQFFWRRDFKRGKHARRRRLYKITNQSLRVIHEWEWRRLGWPEQWKRQYFRHRTATGWQSRPVTTYLCRYEDLFELYTERNFIHELPLHQPELESRFADVEAAIGMNGMGRLDNLTGRRKWQEACEKDRQRERTRHARDVIHRVMRGDWEAEKNRRSTAVSSHLPICRISSHGPQALK